LIQDRKHSGSPPAILAFSLFVCIFSLASFVVAVSNSGIRAWVRFSDILTIIFSLSAAAALLAKAPKDCGNEVGDYHPMLIPRRRIADFVTLKHTHRQHCPIELSFWYFLKKVARAPATVRRLLRRSSYFIIVHVCLVMNSFFVYEPATSRMQENKVPRPLLCNQRPSLKPRAGINTSLA
jgi:hypothetical protein